MRLSTNFEVPVYTIAGSSTARPLPEWLIRKRKRSLKKDSEFANRIELLQDFEFEEASSCVRVSEDGNWVMSTGKSMLGSGPEAFVDNHQGTYKPQLHVHYLPHLSLSFARHTETLNQTFILLSSDYSKSLHLQADRFLQFHTPGGCYYSTRIPRYGRGLAYDRRSTEALIPCTGLNAEGNGEVYRLNLELGRFMKAYEVEVGGNDSGVEALQGGVNAGSVNAAAIAEESHNLLAFGTSMNTVEFWDSRSRSRAGILALPPGRSAEGYSSEVTAVKFHSTGLTMAAGDSAGLIYLYDLRSPIALLKKDQGFGLPIKTLDFLECSSRSRGQNADSKILSADKRIIKIWDAQTGTPWTSVQPEVDLNHVEWCKDSGMILTANEGRQQHAFFVPQLGPAPRWCSFLDNLVEEMAEDPSDPNAFGNKRAGEVYDNFKFLTLPQLRALSIDHLIGRTSLLRPYMHGYFVSQKLYEEASLISNPEFWQEQRVKSIKEKIDKERESRIRGKKKAQVKVNKRLVERMLEREEKNERRKAKRVLVKGGDENAEAPVTDADAVLADKATEPSEAKKPGLLSDPRFARLFEDEAYEIDERSREFAAINPSTVLGAAGNEQRIPKGLTSAEQEELEEHPGSSSSEDSNESDADAEADEGYKSRRRPQAQPQKQHERRSQQQPQMRVLSSKDVQKPIRPRERDKSFGDRAARLRQRNGSNGATSAGGVGEKEVTFVPQRKDRPNKLRRDADGNERGNGRVDKRDRRSASGNVFRKM